MTNLHAEFTTKITAIEDVAEETKKFSFEMVGDAPTEFTPGQFFLLKVDEKTFRAYSIASTPRKLPKFDLLIKYVPGGMASEFLWNEVEVGSEISFRGPMGRFGIRNPEKKQIFVATGTGLAPMRCFLQSLTEKENTPEMHLVFGVRKGANVFCQKELEEYSEKYSETFRYNICLSRPEEGITRGLNPELEFTEGRVTDFLRSMPKEEFENAEVLLCGSKGMVTEVKEILTEKGVENDVIGVESW